VPGESPAGVHRRACNYRGCMLAEQEAFAEARDHFDRSIALDPRFAPAYCNRARMWLELGDVIQARADGEALRAFDPHYPLGVSTREMVDLLHRLREARGGTFTENAAAHGLLDFLRAYDRPPRPGEVGAVLAEQQSPFVVPELPADPTVEQLNHFGVVVGRIGRYAEAIDALTRAIALDDTYDRAYFNRGNAHRLARQYADAERDLSSYIARHPTDDAALALRAEVRRATGARSRAERDDLAARLWSRRSR
jgi:tetratricopeptide (TPR) repeat protein